jgi:hypothetical protein
MSHFFHFIVRPAEALLGAFCLLTAILLYPDEEGKIQSKFEDFWITVDDYRISAISRNAAFMRQVARLESHFLDGVFGVKLVSTKAFVVSFFWSLASLTSVATALTHLFDPRASRVFLGFLIASLLLGGVCVIVPQRFADLCFAIAVGILILGWLWTQIVRHIGLEGFVLFVLPALGGVICDIAFIALTRRMLRWAGEMTHSFRIIFTIALNLILALFLISPSSIILFVEPDSRFGPFGHFLISVSATNIFDLLLALLFILLIVILLIHRAIWPLLSRTLFRMQDIGTKGRRAILTAVGMALLSASIFHEKIPDLLKEVIKAFGG